MNELEKEIIAFHEKQAEIANQQIALSKMENEIIKKYCPFKVGDSVYYRVWNSDTERPGKIRTIRFYGINADAINNRWFFQVRPTKRDFTPIEGRHNMSDKRIGGNREGSIRKAI